jgi:hypothetical protein
MDPGTVPYYLLIVGSPERIPWEFQQHLDGEYAVGRLWFDDPADCEAYVGHLLSYEDRLNRPANGREILFVGTRHPNDGPTQSSAEHLVQPLQEWVATDAGPHFVPSLLLGAENGHGAYKRYVVQRLRGQSLDGGEQPPPAILFTAGHGVEYRRPMETQPTTQGALLFQDWPGPLTPPQPGHYLAGTDIAADTELAPAGMVAFCFACFSVGTPLKQDWVRPTLFRSPAQIASAPFVARLPQKLLAKGLLAFIGHVSRAWEYSFLGAERSGQQIATFRSTLYELLSGQSVGHATDYLNERWLKLNAQLDAQLGAGNVSKEDIAKTWLARNDCRGYAILGDPAARIRVDDLPVG